MHLHIGRRNHFNINCQTSFLFYKLSVKYKSEDVFFVTVNMLKLVDFFFII